ncbi:MAG: CaiB/BaiF CoA-transferase family protein [Myxococcota bacterium]|nr:CaiB/BaiF CoA-transferase family protein [Myxococcota bacterium]
MSEKALLEGLRVVEAATFVAGPAAGTALGDFGADVVHIEHPATGDPYRMLQHLKPLPACERNYPWILTSRGKRSIAIDMKREAGREVVRDLVAGADVFITNFHPSVLADLGLRYEDLAPLNERLIYAHVTGYGDAGAEAEKPGYDATAWWARSGLMDAVRPRGADFGLATAAMGDHPTAVSLLAAIALALFDRERTGRGRRVRTSLIANGAWANGLYVQAALCGASPYLAPTHGDTPNALVNAYGCADGGSIYLAMVQEGVEWERFTDAIGRPELRSDPRFAELEARRAHSADLVALLDEVFATRPLLAWREILDAAEVTFGIVARTEDLPGDPQMRANGVFRPIEGDPHDAHTLDTPLQLDGAEKVAARPAPEIGQHTREVLVELGYTDERIEKLVADGAVRAG